MYAPERHRAIIEHVSVAGRASVVELAESLDVTPETIRRDLSILERQGLVRRVHGGAIPVLRLDFEPTVDRRSNVLIDEKQRIAMAALDEVPQAGAVILDAGTSVGQIIPLISDDRELTVVTNSVQHALLLASCPNINLLLVGGRVRGRTLACVDSWATSALKGLCADVAIVGTDGVSVQRGLTTPDRTEAEIKSAMLAAARRKIVLADHTKFGTDHFASFATLEEIDVIITDAGVDDEVSEQIEAAGPMIVRA